MVQVGTYPEWGFSVVMIGLRPSFFLFLLIAAAAAIAVVAVVAADAVVLLLVLLPFVEPAAAPVIDAVALAGVIDGAFACCACGVCFRAGRAAVAAEAEVAPAPAPTPALSLSVVDCGCCFCCPPFMMTIIYKMRQNKPS